MKLSDHFLRAPADRSIFIWKWAQSPTATAEAGVSEEKSESICAGMNPVTR
jgi:hypothetical protein